MTVGLKLAKATRPGKGLAAGLRAGTAGSMAGGAIWDQGSRGQRQLALGSGLVGGALAAGVLAGRPDPPSRTTGTAMAATSKSAPRT